MGKCSWYMVLGRDCGAECLDLESLDSLLYQGLLSGSLHMAQCLMGPCQLLGLWLAFTYT